MAEKTKKTIPPMPKQSTPLPKPKARFSFLKATVILLALLVIGCAGFAAGVYLNVIDVNKLAADWKLHQYPVIGRYFPVPPQTNFETVELTDSATEQTVEPAQPTQSVPVTKPDMAVPQETPLTSEEMQKLEKAKQQEEAKRIGKMARLYGAMKPEEAVPILNQLADQEIITIFSKMEEEQVAKLLANLDSNRAARLTQAMLKSKPL
ncbi:magnesium transporter MgtE N-terminal domain-containing protein [Anaerospora sp.]|uniref:magnesium transporter MgtE N-terminal domain-containing protein n=1 Tax=Anaerospora sp. TaxID=1960278 RepID=UPI00289C1BB2|nr:magnesium transporter MgtE [Anaerospora sp.]